MQQGHKSKSLILRAVCFKPSNSYNIQAKLSEFESAVETFFF